MRTKPYSAYKESEVRWIGPIPSHWTVKPIKWLSAVRRGASPRPIDDQKYFAEDGEFAWVRIADVSSSGDYLETTTQRLSELGSSLSVKLIPGSLFISIAGTVGKPCITKIKACIHDGFVYFPNLSQDPRFLLYIFLAGSAFAGLGKLGTQLNLNTETVGNIIVPVPPPAEAAKICDFLDRETAKIDTLIAKQTEFMTRLEEHRHAVINNAVTRGTDDSVATKETRIYWMMQIPIHWIVGKIGRYYEVQLGKMLDGSCQTGNHLAPYLRVFDVQWGKINIDNLPEMDFTAEDRKRFLLRSGDLLVNEGGSYVGRSAIWLSELDECYYQKALHRVRPRAGSDTNRFLFYIMYAATKLGVFVTGGNQTTIDHLTAEQFRQYRYPRPPYAEQIAIADYLDASMLKIDAAHEQATALIAILGERRAALITAAVTGQIDVTEPAMAEAAA